MMRELERCGLACAVSVSSAGIAPYARDGALVSLDTILALRDEGIDLGESPRSRDLRRHPRMLEEADLVLAMTQAQEAQLRERFPAARSRPVYTLRQFAGEAGDIEDPFEQGSEAFAACREEIKRLIPKVLERMLSRD